MDDGPLKNSLLQDSREGSINGISIASFLQLLEQDSHSCRVLVQSGQKKGLLFFHEGDLIDAEYDNIRGIEAAYAIISWPDPRIALNDSENRDKIINHPLGYILLNAAKRQDEQGDNDMKQPKILYTSEEAENNPEFQHAVAVLTSIRDIQYFYLLNKAGKIVVHSAPSMILGELIIYCIITSNNLRKTLKTKSPRSIHMMMENGTSLLIIPKAGNIMGMILNSDCQPADVADQINYAFSLK